MRYILKIIFLFLVLDFILGCKSVNNEKSIILTSSPELINNLEGEKSEEKPQTIIVPTGTLETSLRSKKDAGKNSGICFR